ncbi:hypothetical protein RRG08_063948 [Elysia crispata]|uniref:Uncharacterized protein n=1 Tax=Elysia crispata TaxID=231223 RepID=A0AAE0YEX5_9GAST|nr:hypothetical protein RRG08_063948 [Elysia crispata]
MYTSRLEPPFLSKLRAASQARSSSLLQQTCKLLQQRWCTVVQTSRELVARRPGRFFRVLVLLSSIPVSVGAAGLHPVF